MAGRYVGFGKKLFDLAKGSGDKSNVTTTIVGVAPKVNKTKLDEAKSRVAKSSQKLKATTAKLGQTQFEIKNKLPLTFDKSSKKTMSNTELRKAAEAKKKEKKQENKTRHFYVPKNFNKGGRVGLKGGSFPDLSGDGETTMKDILIGRGVIPKPKGKKKMMAKKSKTPMDKAIKKKNKKRII